jgi:hypothetical protein
VIGVIAYAVPVTKNEPEVRADITLRDVIPGQERAVEVTARLNPPDAADDAHWFLITAWQGQEGRSVVSQMKEIAPGVWRSQEPLPVHGTWKTTLRLHRGSDVAGLPVYFPEDKAIPAKAVPATASFTRTFVDDKELLQREQKPSASGGLVVGGYLVVLLIAIVLVGAIVAGLARLERVTSRPGAKPIEHEPLVAAAEVAADGGGEQVGGADERSEGKKFVSS